MRPEGAFLDLEGSKMLETHSHFHFSAEIVELTGFVHSGLQAEKCDWWSCGGAWCVCCACEEGQVKIL